MLYILYIRFIIISNQCNVYIVETAKMKIVQFRTHLRQVHNSTNSIA